MNSIPTLLESSEFARWFTAALTVVLIVGSMCLGAWTDLLRDKSRAGKAPYSFASLQLLWWILIVAFCCLRYFSENLELPTLNATCLILLGIGGGTKMIAAVIDRRQEETADQQGIARSQDFESKGFWSDVLSDEKGLSVHRLQAFIFNVIYGVAFYTYFVRHSSEEMPFDTYTDMQFAVLGLSSVGYLGLKALENKPDRKNTPGANPGGGDELLDADPLASSQGASG